MIVQEKDDFCLCSVLQSILGRYNISTTQQEIADNLTPVEKVFNVNDERIRDFLRRKGFEYQFYWHDETPFNERDEVLDEMRRSNGIIGVKSHVYLLLDFIGYRVEIVDPKDGKVIFKDLYNLFGEMRATNGFFGVIKSVS